MIANGPRPKFVRAALALVAPVPPFATATVPVTLVAVPAVVAVGAGFVELEAVGVALDPVFFEDQRDDFRRRHLLVDALVGAVMQVLQMRHQGDFVACEAFAGIALSDAVDLAVDAGALRIEGQKSLLVQEFFEVQIRVFADQFEVEAIRLTDAFGAAESDNIGNLQVLSLSAPSMVRLKCVSLAGLNIVCSLFGCHPLRPKSQTLQQRRGDAQGVA